MDKESTKKTSDFLKKLLTINLSAPFLSEESLKTLLSDFTLPKELFQSLLDTTQNTKKDFIATLTYELAQSITKQIDFKKYLDNLLKNNHFHVNLSISPKKKSS